MRIAIGVIHDYSGVELAHALTIEMLMFCELPLCRREALVRDE